MSHTQTAGNYCYALMDIEAVPVDVAVDGDRARVLESKTTRILYSVRLGTSSPGEPPASQTVNTRTLAPGRSAPERLLSEKST